MADVLQHQFPIGVACRHDVEVDSGDHKAADFPKKKLLRKHTTYQRMGELSERREENKDSSSVTKVIDFYRHGCIQAVKDEPLHLNQQKWKMGRIQSSLTAPRQIIARLNMEPILHHGPCRTEKHITHSVLNSIRRGEVKADAPRNRGLTKASRATIDLALDRRTIQMLEKLMKWNVFSELFGCISTGKEANVYLGIRKVEDSSSQVIQQRAIKVFKTSILVFKNRARYVEGEYRFRRGYARSSNPRKMVRQWAEKEFRNLRRLASRGMRCPFPIELRGHVIAMGFLGGPDGSAAPKLKNLLQFKDTLPQECQLVHGDFSEYNLLFYRGHPYVIDVSQAVEQDHPEALEFLKRDCANVNRFFSHLLLEDNEVADEDESDQSYLKNENSKFEKVLNIKKNDWNLDLRYYTKEAENVCGYQLSSEWSLYSVQDLFDYITKPNFLKVQKEHSSKWVEFDIEERQHVTHLQISVSNRPPSHHLNKPLHRNVTVGDGEEDSSRARATISTISSRPTAHLDYKIFEHRNYFRCTCAATLEDLCNRFENSLESYTEGSLEAIRAQQEVEEQVFLNTTTPCSLQHLTNLVDVEEEIAKQKRGHGSKYLAFLAPFVSQSETISCVEDSDQDSEKPEMGVDDSESTESGEKENSSENEVMCKNRHREVDAELFTGCIPENMDPKEWKKLVKEKNRERRKHKIPKYLKKKKKKKATGNCKR